MFKDYKRKRSRLSPRPYPHKRANVDPRIFDKSGCWLVVEVEVTLITASDFKVFSKIHRIVVPPYVR